MFSNPALIVLFVVLVVLAWSSFTDWVKPVPVRDLDPLSGREFCLAWLRKIPQSRSFTSIMRFAGLLAIFIPAGFFVYDWLGHTVPTKMGSVRERPCVVDSVGVSHSRGCVAHRGRSV